MNVYRLFLPILDGFGLNGFICSSDVYSNTEFGFLFAGVQKIIDHCIVSIRCFNKQLCTVSFI